MKDDGLSLTYETVKKIMKEYLKTLDIVYASDQTYLFFCCVSIERLLLVEGDKYYTENAPLRQLRLGARAGASATRLEERTGDLQELVLAPQALHHSTLQFHTEKISVTFSRSQVYP